MFLRFTVLLLSISSSISISFGQDTLIQLEEMDSRHILDFSPAKESKVYAALRMVEDPENVDGTVFIITQQEILANGYVTLVDVLNDVVGIRTSQPGTATQGEAFTMRGLIGNSKTKILINGTSIKPFQTEGVGLAAQLPIAQADRIEIIFGPAASLYGSDAVAGVINIVIEEADRPIEAMVSTSINSGTSKDINASVAGKMFKDKNVLSFLLYSNARNINEYAVDYAKTIDTSTIVYPFFIGEVDDPTVAFVNNLNHSSSLVGARVDFREWTYNVQLMNRKDPSSLGASPSVISFSDVGSYFEESVNRHVLTYDKTFFKRWNVLSNVSYSDYEIDQNSSFIGLNHPISNSRNYVYAKSRDIFGEVLGSYSGQRFKGLVGASYLNSSGIAKMNYLARPYNEGSIFLNIDGEESINLSNDEWSNVSKAQLLPRYSTVNSSIFGQASYNLNKLVLHAGLRYEILQDFENIFNPKLALIFKPTDFLKFTGSYTSASQEPSQDLLNNHYLLVVEPPPALQVDGFKQVGYEKESLSPLTIENIEFNAQFSVQKMTFSLTYFRHQINNKILPRFQKAVIDTLGNYFPGTYDMGYTNIDGQAILNGLEFTASYMSTKLFVQFGVDYFQGQEELDFIGTIDGYQATPTFSGKLNVRYTFNEKNRITLNGQIHSDFVDRVTVFRNTAVQTDATGYSNLNLGYTRTLNDQFYLSLRAKNIFNTNGKGIFTNWISGGTLEYIPVYQRTFSLGITYNLR